MLLEEPVIAVREVPPIPTEAPPEVEETVPATTAPPDQKEPPQVSATRYFAYDLRKDMFLAQKGDGDAKLYPASITKLLTCHVMLQYLEPDDKVTVGDAMNLVQFDSSLANLKEGDELTVEQLVAAMMLPSGNDAAQVAAVAAGRAIAGDPSLSYTEAVEVFVREMNLQAWEMGMINSHFANPDGFHHDDHYTSMNDLITLCKTVLTNQTILKYTSKVSEEVILPDRTLTWENTNFLLDSDGQTYLPNTIGLKTGYTGKAGSCLMSAFFMEDRILLIGVFGCPAFTEDRYLDTVAIYNYI
jgi:D-alanyl-D-alanine carboxypeptidase (penicillin-binding protein 5/6)